MRERDGPKRGNALRKILITLAILGIASCAAIWLLPVSLPVSENPRFASSAQLWPHRGSGGRQFPENSPESVTLAVSEGFKGVELDIFYLPDGDKIAVSHDFHDEASDVLMPPLENFTFPADLALWLDFKNLGSLSEAEIDRFSKSFRRLRLPNEIFVESKSIEKLRLLDPAQFRRVYWLLPPKQDWWNQTFYLARAKFAALFAGMDAVSVSRRHFNLVAPHFRGRSMFVFTVNDPMEVSRFWRSDRVAVILTGLERSAVLDQIGTIDRSGDETPATSKRSKGPLD